MADSDPSSLSWIGLWLTRGAPWVPLAVLSYAATVTVGTLSMRGRRIRRSWHARLFIVTCALTAAAAVFSFPQAWVRGMLLLAALVPLALLPFVTAPVARHPRRHVALGLLAAPCYIAALALWSARPG
ncbi:hypothetical protein [Leucobacter sp. gxy201]|uniref:hypothetical protein n=1 Tax=Leucobacter sp. gxy201 TaxID=2957200 RepID=UPI003DA0B0E8